MGWLSSCPFLEEISERERLFLNVRTMAGMNQYLLEYGIVSVFRFSVPSWVGILLKSCVDEL